MACLALGRPSPALALPLSAGVKPGQVSIQAAALGAGQRWRARPVSHVAPRSGWQGWLQADVPRPAGCPQLGRS